MKKITKRILLISGILIVTILIALAVVFLQLRSNIKKMANYLILQGSHSVHPCTGTYPRNHLLSYK
jgi:hypothetical protein